MTISSDFSADVIEPHLNETFEFTWPDGSVNQGTLIEVLRLEPPKQTNTYSWRKETPKPNVRQNPFSMIFLIQAEQGFHQSMCTIKHEKLTGQLPDAVMCVLIDAEGENLYYEVLFN